MNQADRNRVANLQAKLEDLKTEVETIGVELRELADQEQEKFDNLTEGLRASEKGQAIEQAASTLDSIASSAEEGDLANALDELDNLEGL